MTVTNPPNFNTNPNLGNGNSNGQIGTSDFQSQIDFIQTNIDNTSRFMQEINDYVNRTNQIALDTSLNQAQMALSMGLLEAQGIKAQLELNNVTTALNIQTDLTQLGSRNALMLASKAYESATLIAQFREKTLGMFISISEQRTNTTWGRIKQLTQGFKF